MLDPELYEDWGEGMGKGGGGGGKREGGKYVDPNRGKQVGEEMREAREGGEEKIEASLRVTEKVSSLLDKDESADFREVCAYFEWLRIGLLCAEEIENMTKTGSGDMELAWEMMMKESDLDEEFVKSGGPGGQNANKVNSAVRLCHLPSKIQVKVKGRDQFQNRPRAQKLLREKTLEHISGWNKVIGKADSNEVMAEVFQRVIDKKGEAKGVRGDKLREIKAKLKEGKNL